jgi:hypothetical protein
MNSRRQGFADYDYLVPAVLFSIATGLVLPVVPMMRSGNLSIICGVTLIVGTYALFLGPCLVMDAQGRRQMKELQDREDRPGSPS